MAPGDAVFFHREPYIAAVRTTRQMCDEPLHFRWLVMRATTPRAESRLSIASYCVPSAQAEGLFYSRRIVLGGWSAMTARFWGLIHIRIGFDESIGHVVTDFG